MKTTLSNILGAASRKNLPFLLIGGHAVILSGFPRNTIDIDLLAPDKSRSAWMDLMRELKFRLYHGAGGFAQFEPSDPEMVAVDFMFVDDLTWERLSHEPVARQIEGQYVRIPHPEHLVALKLHAAASPNRSRREADWEDIRQLVLICGLDPADPTFREIILRYGGENALLRIESFLK